MYMLLAIRVLQVAGEFGQGCEKSMDTALIQADLVLFLNPYTCMYNVVPLFYGAVRRFMQKLHEIKNVISTPRLMVHLEIKID